MKKLDHKNLDSFNLKLSEWSISILNYSINDYMELNINCLHISYISPEDRICRFILPIDNKYKIRTSFATSYNKTFPAFSLHISNVDKEKIINRKRIYFTDKNEIMDLYVGRICVKGVNNRKDCLEFITEIKKFFLKISETNNKVTNNLNDICNINFKI